MSICFQVYHVTQWMYTCTLVLCLLLPTQQLLNYQPSNSTKNKDIEITDPSRKNCMTLIVFKKTNFHASWYCMSFITSRYKRNITNPAHISCHNIQTIWDVMCRNILWFIIKMFSRSINSRKILVTSLIISCCQLHLFIIVDHTVNSIPNWKVW